MESLQVANPFPGALCLLVRKTDSTQAEARRLALGPGAALAFPSGSLVAADEQSAGRGRLPGRSWSSESGLNLLFTLFLAPAAARLRDGSLLPGLPIRAALALCEAVEGQALAMEAALPRAPRIKWPNDLMLGDAKAAGILCEAGPFGVLVGVGLNCNQLAFPPGLRTEATSLALELGREVGRWETLERFLGRFAAGLGDPLWREKAAARLWRRGEAAAFAPGIGEAAPLRGLVAGLAEDGSLLFRAEGEAESRSFASGELRRGPG